MNSPSADGKNRLVARRNCSGFDTLSNVVWDQTFSGANDAGPQPFHDEYFGLRHSGILLGRRRSVEVVQLNSSSSAMALRPVDTLDPTRIRVRYQSSEALFVADRLIYVHGGDGNK